MTFTEIAHDIPINMNCPSVKILSDHHSLNPELIECFQVVKQLAMGKFGSVYHVQSASGKGEHRIHEVFGILTTSLRVEIACEARRRLWNALSLTYAISQVASSLNYQFMYSTHVRQRMERNDDKI